MKFTVLTIKYLKSKEWECLAVMELEQETTNHPSSLDGAKLFPIFTFPGARLLKTGKNNPRGI